LLLVSALVVAAAVVGAGVYVAKELAAARGELARARSLELMTVFASGIAAAATDPRALLVWQPLAASARALYPAEFLELDKAAGGRFPFTREQIEDAHARWSADWLTWEQSHDATYKMKAAEIQREIAAGGSAALRDRLDAVEREKLELYQRRYSDYVRVSKGLQALTK
jgi:hypothetical protein